MRNPLWFAFWLIVLLSVSFIVGFIGAFFYIWMYLLSQCCDCCRVSIDKLRECNLFLMLLLFLLAGCCRILFEVRSISGLLCGSHVELPIAVLSTSIGYRLSNTVTMLQSSLSLSFSHSVYDE